MVEQTKLYLNDFAEIGLWTLLLAEKVISQEEYDNWNSKYKEALLSLDWWEEKVEAISSEIE